MNACVENKTNLYLILFIYDVMLDLCNTVEYVYCIFLKELNLTGISVESFSVVIEHTHLYKYICKLYCF